MQNYVDFRNIDTSFPILIEIYALRISNSISLITTLILSSHPPYYLHVLRSLHVFLLRCVNHIKISKLFKFKKIEPFVIS